MADILSKKVVLFTHAAYTFTHGKMKIQRNLLEMLENKVFFKIILIVKLINVIAIVN